MHELGLAEEIYRVCRSSLASHGPGKILSVRLAIGELAAVEPELLHYAWRAVTEDGPHAGAGLEIEWRRARQRCSQCGSDAQREPGGWLSVCASCGGLLRVSGGRELDVLDLEVELTDGAETTGAPVTATGGSSEEDA